MAKVELKGIYKVYTGNVTAVDNCSLDIEDKEFVVLVGPSGCGKSTTLRMIAGLEEITKGELFIGDKLCNDVAPKDRDIAMVFQNYALYPHMTVYENMAFGLKLRKMPKDIIEKKVKEAAAVLDIEHLLDRKPKALSGGQRQRVALGRAIVREPKVFLMDEPLSNLDAKLRVQMRTEISKLHKRLNTTFIYVTHDQTEAMTMGTRIVVMKDGLVQQVDTPQNIYESPTNIFVAGFIGSPQMNFAKCMVTKEGDKLFVIFGATKLQIPQSLAKTVDQKGYAGKEVIFGIRPEDIDDGADFMREYGDNILEANVDVIEHMGSETYLYVVCEGNNMVARVEPTSKAKLDEKVKLGVNMNKMHLFDVETENTIV
jgi:multiple sugar transport system ATP-binding protein